MENWGDCVVVGALTALVVAIFIMVALAVWILMATLGWWMIPAMVALFAIAGVITHNLDRIRRHRD